MRNRFRRLAAAGLIFVASQFSPAAQDSSDLSVYYRGAEGPGAGKRIVLVAGDEEYRSEEALPLLGRILAGHYGFESIVLFPIDPETGVIDPTVTDNIPGLKALASADLMILFTRFRNLQDSQMEAIDAYLKSGRPVLGIRTATHAFRFEPDTRWAHYGNGYSGEEKPEWTGGFGRLVLGERWVAHHGSHKEESTRGILPEKARGHPLVRGLSNGDVWGASDVYAVRLPLPGNSFPLLLGQVLARRGPYQEEDLLYGMRPDDGPPVAEKNDPMMPIAWTRSYQLPEGRVGRAFVSTIGASVDLLSEGTRRLLVNGVFWALEMESEIPAAGTRIDLVGKFEPTQFEFRSPSYWKQLKMRPSDHAWPAADETAGIRGRKGAAAGVKDLPKIRRVK